MAPFADDLRYHQPDGKVITRDVLIRQVADQFARISAADWTFQVEHFETVGDLTVETGVQRGWIAATAFGFLHRIWTLERRSRYTWREGPKGWQIVEAMVLFERLSGAGFQLGRRPRGPSPSGAETN